jgi:hypothetical protein
MSQSLQQRRWAENEVVFRKRNKEVIENVETAESIAKDDKQEDLVKVAAHDRLLFFCECANEKCHDRVELTLNQYKKYHRNGSQFIVLPGHHVPEIERIIHKTGTFYVVEKYMTPPSDAEQLNPTAL